jgi:hypothetical protein
MAEAGTASFNRHLPFFSWMQSREQLIFANQSPPANIILPYYSLNMNGLVSIIICVDLNKLQWMKGKINECG